MLLSVFDCTYSAAAIQPLLPEVLPGIVRPDQYSPHPASQKIAARRSWMRLLQVAHYSDTLFQVLSALYLLHRCMSDLMTPPFLPTRLQSCDIHIHTLPSVLPCHASQHSYFLAADKFPQWRSYSETQIKTAAAPDTPPRSYLPYSSFALQQRSRRTFFSMHEPETVYPAFWRARHLPSNTFLSAVVSYSTSKRTSSYSPFISK